MDARLHKEENSDSIQNSISTGNPEGFSISPYPCPHHCDIQGVLFMCKKLRLHTRTGIVWPWA